LRRRLGRAGGDQRTQYQGDQQADTAQHALKGATFGQACWQLMAHPGRRDELMAGIRELKNADGCDLYVVSREVDDRNTMWVVEAWRDDAAHRAALDTPEVRAVIERGI
jgi:quinol monooxygenase YgiN